MAALAFISRAAATAPSMPLRLSPFRDNNAAAPSTPRRLSPLHSSSSPIFSRHRIEVFRQHLIGSPSRNHVSCQKYLRARDTPAKARATAFTSASATASGAPQGERKRVVITGGSKGLGYAMAEEFLSMGDSVVICGRNNNRLTAAVDALRRSEKAANGDDLDSSDAEFSAEPPSLRVWGIRCDVASAADLAGLAEFAVARMGGVDIWINNAGQVTSKSLLADVAPSDIASAVSTNVLGSLLGCREAIRVMRQQQADAPAASSSSTPLYHIFNLGFSRWGAAFTRSAATHKATKMALSQLTTSLNDELKQAGLTSIAVHNLSPGMVLTDLLLKDSTPIARRFFNALAEEPETVAAAIVPLIRSVAGPNENVEYMSPVDAFVRVITGVPQIVKGGRFFDGNGDRVMQPGNEYASNGVKRQFYDP
ncbi:hypothetical protein CLOM_g4527 [Closterium sp. NIES-68]|nr:hypothetical protein CLOM_g4527 [Closterium sp. NIES-68]GJP71384.1 hypothetical protein CLOP_g2220 [Closterium sp. NIES-67]